MALFNINVFLLLFNNIKIHVMRKNFVVVLGSVNTPSLISFAYLSLNMFYKSCVRKTNKIFNYSICITVFKVFFLKTLSYFQLYKFDILFWCVWKITINLQVDSNNKYWLCIISRKISVWLKKKEISYSQISDMRYAIN